MISMGKQGILGGRWPSPLAEFLTGSHIILIKRLKLFDGQVSLGFRLRECVNGFFDFVLQIWEFNV